MAEAKFIYSTLAIGNSTPVNISLVYVFETATGADYSPGRTEEGVHQIHFRRSEHFNGPKDIVWKYCTVKERDTEYELLISNFATKIST